MSDLNAALMHIYDNEGGYTEDHAGPTKYGVTIPTLQAYYDRVNIHKTVTKQDVVDLNWDTAKDVYKILWWEEYGYNKILDTKLATKVFDMSINMGPVQAHKLVQRGCQALGFQIKDDGKLGPKTLKTLNMSNTEQLLSAIRAECAAFYRRLAESNPTKFGQYLDGWLDRAYE